MARLCFAPAAPQLYLDVSKHSHRYQLCSRGKCHSTVAVAMGSCIRYEAELPARTECWSHLSSTSNSEVISRSNARMGAVCLPGRLTKEITILRNPRGMLCFSSGALAVTECTAL